MATLYLVSTPIGNLSDMSRRGAEVLGSVDRVLAEDTRRTRVLLEHLGIRVPLVSLHAHNEAARVEAVLGWLAAGESVALVSDAGTPLLSDPGERLVAAVADRGHPVIPVPGPSALLAALVASGLPTVPFLFLGFLPRKGGERADALERVASVGDTTVLYESPERLVGLLEELVERCGPERKVAVARELTKIHEEIVRGTMEEALRYYRESSPRGEVTLVVAGSPPVGAPDQVDRQAARALAQALLDGGESPSRVARDVARRLGIPRRMAYEIVHNLPGSGG